MQNSFELADHSNAAFFQDASHQKWMDDLFAPPAPDAPKPGDGGKPGPEAATKPSVFIDPLGLEIDLISGTADYQKSEIQIIENLPPTERKLLHDKGVKYAVVSRVPDLDPEMDHQQPRGWPPNTTWGDTDGAFMDDRNTVVLAEKTNSGPATRREGVCRHESGHAFDQSLNNFSTSQAFEDAYKADLARMPEADKKDLSYLLQAGGAGEQETFAEVYAGLNGGTCNQRQTVEIMRDFLAVKAVVAKEELEVAGLSGQKA